MDDHTRCADFAPQQGWQWLRPFIPKSLQPTLRGARKRYQLMSAKLPEPYRSVYPYSQVNQARQGNLVRLGELVVVNNVPGALVECGVLDGGTAALMGWATRHASPPREIHLFDAWKGLPTTTEEDGQSARVWTGQVVGSPRRVLAVMKKLEIDERRIEFHRGWFHETFPAATVEPVAMVHIDCDFYEPTQLSLARWYPLLSPGGYMQVDDYSAFSGCQRAVDEFLFEHPEVKMQAGGEDGSTFYFQKPLR